MRRAKSFVLVCLVAICGPFLAFDRANGVEEFTPPTKSLRMSAIGSLVGVPNKDRRFYRESASFDPIPVPGQSDWLNGPGKLDRPGQTFAEFKKSFRNPISTSRRTLYIQPLGDVDETARDLTGVLRDFTQAYYQLPVKTLPSMNPRALGVTRRINQQTRKPQLLTTDILKAMKQSVPKDAYCVIALTLTDLYPQESWNFVFGQASLRERVGVFSLARYSPAFYDDEERTPQDDALLTLRACKVLSHEFGHMFGARHCIFYHCNLNGSNHLQETDRAPIHLCPVCLRKLQSVIKFDHRRRYEQLREFYESHSLEEESIWVNKRLP